MQPRTTFDTIARVNLKAFSIALVCIAATACGPTPSPHAPPPLPQFDKFDPATTANLDVAALPIIPEITPAMKNNLLAIYAAGQKKGNNGRVFSKLGDCMTENEFFMGPISAGKYDLAEYTSLKPTIEHFRGVPSRGTSGKDWKLDSFATVGLASAGGYNVAGPLDPTWSNPDFCSANESPLACEYRVSKPAFAIIMFGTNDVPVTDLPTFDYYLRTTISSTIDAGVIPILNTFPTRPENPDKSKQLNQIVAKIAQDYGVPLVNLNRALAALPNQGVNPGDTTHLSAPPDKRTDMFTPDHLRYGFTTRNLVTVQALEKVLTAVQ